MKPNTKKKQIISKEKRDIHRDNIKNILCNSLQILYTHYPLR
jgi:hypothetical protein